MAADYIIDADGRFDAAYEWEVSVKGTVLGRTTTADRWSFVGQMNGAGKIFMSDEMEFRLVKKEYGHVAAAH